jgi:predicted Na+-dependent transporter
LMGKPCPSCGMTTAFSLLVHGDVANSLKANWVGTILAVYWFALIPWAIVSAVRGKLLWVRSGDWLMTISVIVFLVLVLGRWAGVLMR